MVPRIYIFLFVAVSLWSQNQSSPAILWHKTYHGSGEESHPHYVIQTKDLGYLMVGETGFVENRSARILLVKTDRNGILLWQKEFGKRGYNLGNCVCEAEDGNYLITGTLGMDAALIKVEAKTGKTIWSRTWNLGSEDSFEGLCLSPDGGILVTGYRDGLAEGTFLNWGRGILLKTNSVGEEIWRQDLSDYTCSGYRIQSKGEGFLISCHPRDEESEDYNLLWVNAKGKVKAARTYGEIYWGFDQNKQGDILLVGHTRTTPLSKNLDIQFKILDAKGNPHATSFSGNHGAMMADGFTMRFGGQGLPRMVAGWRWRDQATRPVAMRAGGIPPVLQGNGRFI